MFIYHEKGLKGIAIMQGLQNYHAINDKLLYFGAGARVCIYVCVVRGIEIDKTTLQFISVSSTISPFVTSNSAICIVL